MYSTPSSPGIGGTLLDERPRPGAEGSKIAFVHPAVLGGVLLELKQKAD